MLQIEETKSKEYFQSTMAELIQKQNMRRDLMLEALLKSQVEKAKNYLDQVQLFSTGIQACQQSIERINKFETDEAKRLADSAKPKVTDLPFVESTTLPQELK